jgi:hypothetical protein
MTAADEGRDFLASVIWDESCEWSPDDLDEKEDHEIETWLEELGYEWNGGSWVAVN